MIEVEEHTSALLRFWNVQPPHKWIWVQKSQVSNFVTNYFILSNGISEFFVYLYKYEPQGMEMKSDRIT